MRRERNMGNSHNEIYVTWRNRWNIDWLHAGSGTFAESKFLSLAILRVNIGRRPQSHPSS